MGECRLDHSTEDVRNKLAEQTPFLPCGTGRAAERAFDGDAFSGNLERAVSPFKEIRFGDARRAYST